MINPILGISAERPLPQFGSALNVKRLTFNVQSSNLTPDTPTPDTSSRETVLYLPDAFTRHFEPEIESAALSLLDAAGINLIEIPLLGAGRTLISKGFLPEARTHHLKLLDAIRRLDPGGELPILGIEPSELYTLKDELRDLVPAGRRPEAVAIAARAFLIDEFLVRNSPGAQDKRVANLLANISPVNQQPDTAHLTPDTSSPDTVLLHGHCYQKAQPPAPDGFPVGQAATAAFLRALGFDVEIVPSGCCGMAGAFGYEKEHYDVSMAVGELVLLPTVRAASIDTQIAAPGASCRAQIADGANRAADHPLVIAAKLLKRKRN